MDLERKRLKEPANLEEERKRLTVKLANQQFVSKVPPAVVEKNEEAG